MNGTGLNSLILAGFLILAVLQPASAQIRAVWVATAHRIDFPKTNGAAAQQAELKALMSAAHQSGINTLIFQARGRGDAFYQSEHEPWSESLTGTLGQSPGWDPLQMVLAETTNHPMRVIAWFNVFKVADATSQTRSASGLRHPAEANPGWILRAGGESFLNPGIPAVRDYLARVAADLVRRYAVDGIQLDFIRYPTTRFDDASTLKKYKDPSQSAADFRRWAVSETVRQIHQAVKAIRPGIEVSAAPLGIWKSIDGARGLESYHEVFQDSRGWTAAGYLDAIYPQIYWPAGGISDGVNPGPAPDFNRLIDDWVAGCRPVPVVAGIGIYKPPVLAQADRLESYSLQAGAAGVAFYSWSQFINMKQPARQETKPTLPPVTSNQEPMAAVSLHRLSKSHVFLVFREGREEPVTIRFADPGGSVLEEVKTTGESSRLFTVPAGTQRIRIFTKKEVLLTESVWK
ncbi:MAG: family 10 glycosylhydrolase [Bacteroidetes bacterium]|nr:family 10 glycosylhydrolase [Bacteroidota bacterium]